MKPDANPAIVALGRLLENLKKVYVVSSLPATDGEDVLFATAICFKGEDGKKIATEVRDDIATLHRERVLLGDCWKAGDEEGKQ